MIRNNVSCILPVVNVQWARMKGGTDIYGLTHTTETIEGTFNRLSLRADMYLLEVMESRTRLEDSNN